MQVEILSDIFKEAFHVDNLNNLLVFFRTGKHKLLIRDDDTISSYNNSNWKNELNNKDQLLINKFIVTSSRKSESSIITVSNKSSEYFNPEEAYYYLSQPLIILIENSEYDAPFFDAIIRNFDSNQDLVLAKEKQWWDYGMAAGTSFPQVINTKINSFSNSIFTKDKIKYLRFFVILDSDKLYPEMPISNSKTEFLEKNQIKYHFLYKREKENYIPDNILKIFDDTYLNLYISFNSHQKDFFDLQKGFNKNKSDRDWNEYIFNLFSISKIPNDSFTILKNGIKLEQYLSNKFKSEFSKLFNKADKSNMLKRIEHQPLSDGYLNEFEHIVNEIRKLL
jgi:hypothetical protein